MRGLATSLLWAGTLAILTGQLVAAGKILHVVTGLPTAVGAVMGGVAMTIYFTAGGLLGSAWVNALQLVVEIGTFLVLLPVALAGAGGWPAVVARVPAGSFVLGFLGRGRVRRPVPDPPRAGLLPLARPPPEDLRGAQTTARCAWAWA